MSEKIKAMFEKFEDDFLKAPEDWYPLDLRAFNLLSKLCPGSRYIVQAAEHDEIWFAVEMDELEKSGITEEQVKELVQCGVRYDNNIDCLATFV
jgi:hypothetical protein